MRTVEGKAVYPFYGSRLLKGFQVRQACQAFREQEKVLKKAIHLKTKKTARSIEQTA